jgi:hypothetical protein
MLDWLGEEGDRLRKAFIGTFGERHRPFGNRANARGGLSDGNEGVQWNAGIDPRNDRRWAGVNLEGMKYKGWPVARLIERELRAPTLPALIQRMEEADAAEVHWTRDYWQVSARPRIVEKYIVPTPILLHQLTDGVWRSALEGAEACLDERKGLRGRATQEVTLADGRRVTGGVSPHLTFVYPAAGPVSWPAFLAEARARMQPLYDWAVERAA